MQTIPRLLIVGPIFDTPSGPSGQGGKLFQQLMAEGYVCLKKSAYRNLPLRLLDTLWGVCRFWTYDVILLQSFSLKSFYLQDAVSLLASILGKPVIFTLRGGAFCEFYEQHARWCKRVLSRAHLINTPSYFIQACIQSKGLKVEYVPNFIDLKRFPFDRSAVKKNTLLWVRAFNDIYHPELAIEAVGILKNEFPDIRLTMLGPDQSTLLACQTLIREKGLETQIDIIGPVPNHELFHYYQTHAVYLNTTRYESFGVALVEAASCGIPCVSVSVGEIPFIWKDEEQMLFAKRDAADFASKIKRLLSDPSLNLEMGQRANQRAQSFSWNEIKSYWFDRLSAYKRHEGLKS